MNNDNQLNARSSKCWTCKFGLCVRETDTERVYHAQMRNLDEQAEEHREPWELINEYEQEEDEIEADLIEHTVKQERIKTICYWRPEGIEDTPPIVTSQVQECNRYQRRDNNG